MSVKDFFFSKIYDYKYLFIFISFLIILNWCL